MCSTITVYACRHTHMEKTSCKYKRAGLFCFFPSSKSKCLVVTRVRSDGKCSICRESEYRERREQEANQRRINRDSVIDPEINRQITSLPSFQIPLQTPPAAVVKQPAIRTQPPQQRAHLPRTSTRPQPPRMSTSRSDQRVKRSNAVANRPYRAPVLHYPVPISAGRPRFLEPGRPSPTPTGRPRVSPNIPPSVTVQTIDRSVSPVEPGFMDARAVSPDEYGRAPWHYR